MEKSIAERSADVLSTFTKVTNDLAAINAEAYTVQEQNAEKIEALLAENQGLTDVTAQNSKVIKNIEKILK